MKMVTVSCFMGDKNHPEVKGIISFADDIQIFEVWRSKKIKKLI